MVRTINAEQVERLAKPLLKNEYGKKLRLMVARYYQLRTILNLEQADAFYNGELAYNLNNFYYWCSSRVYRC